MEDMPNELLYNVASYVIDSEHKCDIFSLKSTNKTFETISRDLIAQKRPQYAAKMTIIESQVFIIEHIYNSIEKILLRNKVIEGNYNIYYDGRDRIKIYPDNDHKYIIGNIDRIIITDVHCCVRIENKFIVTYFTPNMVLENRHRSYIIDVEPEVVYNMLHELSASTSANLVYIKMYALLRNNIMKYKGDNYHEKILMC